jgi:precorrin-8X/cobalt-precorrin-8 methylmutase
MLENIRIYKPEEIEKKSFEMIGEILGDRDFPQFHEAIIKRAIHTSADFDYADILEISESAAETALDALRSGVSIVTDTRMAGAGINKAALGALGGEAHCFIDDPVVASDAKEKGLTRSSLCMDRAAKNKDIGIYVVGNAPTALIRLYELVRDGVVRPALIIGVPVGFVNVVESKELIKSLDIPYIVSNGRKGGSNIAASIVNALLYMAKER